MNKAKLLSKDAVRRVSHVTKLTAVEEKSLALTLGGLAPAVGGSDATLVKGPGQAACPHVEYPASAA
jgi:hypothetical protein